MRMEDWADSWKDRWEEFKESLRRFGEESAEGEEARYGGTPHGAGKPFHGEEAGRKVDEVAGSE